MTPWPPLTPLRQVARDDLPPERFVRPFVHDDGQLKSLHFRQEELQSRMRHDQPCALEIDYTRTMMGFLLFNPAPPRIAMVGLGGGSLAKFCHYALPASHLTVVEINPYVIALRSEFSVPDDGTRFKVLEEDGALFIARQAGSLDVLLIDGFDHQGQPEALCSQKFYDDCFAALADNGVLVVNLHHDDADYAVRTKRIRRSFDGNAVEILALEKSNSIVFASRGEPISPRHIHLTESLAGIGAEARRHLRPELARVVWNMQQLAPRDEARQRAKKLWLRFLLLIK